MIIELFSGKKKQRYSADDQPRRAQSGSQPFHGGMNKKKKKQRVATLTRIPVLTTWLLDVASSFP